MTSSSVNPFPSVGLPSFTSTQERAQSGLFAGDTPFSDDTYNGAHEQMRLRRIQTYNWGTFTGLFDFNISPKGYLFVGPSGSGKSTALDAHATLLTPPTHVKFNAAAREGGKEVRDRNLLTYVRGAWAKQTGEGGEAALQYLRSGTTWSAISETYQNQAGRTITLIQVFWIRGNSNNRQDVKRHFLIAHTSFELNALEPFAAADFDVRKLRQIPGIAYSGNEFSGYQSHFTELLGIENALALKLLHKTQSAKNLGDLNEFMRDFMLDKPKTFEVADRLVAEFVELRQAHKCVVDARDQIATLEPAQKESEQRTQLLKERDELDDLEEALVLFRERIRLVMVRQRAQESRTELEAQTQTLAQWERMHSDATSDFDRLRLERLEKSGTMVATLERELQQVEATKLPAMRKREIAVAALKVMGWAEPDQGSWFVERVEAAKEHLAQTGKSRKALDGQRQELNQQRHSANQTFQRLTAEIRSLESQRSNLPARLLQLRNEMSRDLAIAADCLPFVGELLEVRAKEGAWQGAIERVLGGFSRSLLVEERYAGAVMAYINGRNLGTDLTVQKVRQKISGNRGMGQLSLVRKLEIKDGPFYDWLQDELLSSFDFDCVDSVQALDGVSKGVTREGLVKRNSSRHEKRDRRSVDDRSEWVLGFDNKAKLELFKDQAYEAAQEVTRCDEALAALDEQGEAMQEKSLACRDLSNLTWEDVDVASIVARAAELTARLKTERENVPDLSALDEAIADKKASIEEYAHKKSEASASKIAAERDIQVQTQKEASILQRWPEAQSLETVPHQVALENKFAGKETATLENLDSVSAEVRSSLVRESAAKAEEASRLEASMLRRFDEFKRRFPADNDGLDATMLSASDYFAKLERLRLDGLPRFQGRFESLMREQSDQNIASLSALLHNERGAIRTRMELVNESLAGAPYNPGTHLVIETRDMNLIPVKEFRASLVSALSNVGTTDATGLEKKFLELDDLAVRLGSSETEHVRWRALVLDVREHVEFTARELDEQGREVEVYSSAEGKSGGQKQKLATTCLAAALRYQLGGVDRALPRFCTVVMDEAFDKADADFTRMVMNIFKSFGFQLVVATPMKGVMTLEPFIGGASYVHIKDRRHSAVVTIDYDTHNNRLKLTAEQRAEDAESQAA